MSVREKIVAGARRWMGTPYDWGGEGINGEGVDCSGLVIAAYRAAGTPLSGRPIASQIGQMGQAVTIAEALPGDVVYYDRPGKTDHVGIYLGGGKMIDSPTTGQRVGVRDVGNYTSVRRLVTGGSGSEGGEGVLDTLTRIFVPGFGAIVPTKTSIDGAVDDAVSGWAGEALAIGVKLVGTLAAVGLVVAGVMHTVKD